MSELSVCLWITDVLLLINWLQTLFQELSERFPPWHTLRYVHTQHKRTKFPKKTIIIYKYIHYLMYSPNSTCVRKVILNFSLGTWSINESGRPWRLPPRPTKLNWIPWRTSFFPFFMLLVERHKQWKRDWREICIVHTHTCILSVALAQGNSINWFVFVCSRSVPQLGLRTATSTDPAQDSDTLTKFLPRPPAALRSACTLPQDGRLDRLPPLHPPHTVPHR